jgi:hypothetical protein
VAVAELIHGRRHDLDDFVDPLRDRRGDPRDVEHASPHQVDDTCLDRGAANVDSDRPRT